MESFTRDAVVRNSGNTSTTSLGWGDLVWLIGETQTPGTEQTFGLVTIHPGKRNPLHIHPNCEELLYVISGSADHQLGDDLFQITAGDVIRIPRGVPHWAKTTSSEPLVAVISFSAPDRTTENLENSDDLA